MPTRSVQLTISENSADLVDGIPVRRVTLTLSSQIGIGTNKLLVAQKVPTTENPSRIAYRTVACAADLDNLQEDAPPPEDSLQPFRIDTVTLTTDRPSDIENFVATVRRRLAALCQELKRLEDYTIDTTYVITDE